MSAALTHVAMGLLLGLALRVRWRLLPLAGLLAALPDIDHLSLFTPIPTWLLTPRVTFHNLLFCLALPLLVYAVLAWRRAPPDWLKLAAAAPLLLTSHLFLDMLPLDVSGARVPLLWPFRGEAFTASARRAAAVDPTAFSTITLLLLILVVLAALSLGAHAWAQREGGAARTRNAGLAAFVAIWILAFPALLAGGYVEPAPRHPDSTLQLDAPLVLLPQGRLSTLVFDLGGNDISRGALRLEWWAGGSRVGFVTNPVALTRGDQWPVDAPLAGAAATGAVSVRLVAAVDGYLYEERAASVRVGHVATTLTLLDYRADGQGSASVRIGNTGPLDVPPGHVHLEVRASDGSELANATNPDAIASQGAWAVSFRIPPTALAGSSTLQVNAVDDGYAYLAESRQPSVGPTP